MTHLPVNIDVTIRTARPAEAAIVIDLHRRLSEFLGFIPRDGIREHIALGHVLIARRDGEPCGYVIRGALRTGLFRHTRIFQLAVEPSRWRHEIGTELTRHVASDALSACSPALRLHCRDGIPANAFWQAIGFTLREVRLGGTKRRKIVNVWEAPAIPLRS